VTTRVESDLNDDFEPPNPDNDETITFSGNGLYTLYPPRRVRAITSLSTIDDYGNSITQAAGSYRLRSSLNAAGTAMLDGRLLDEIYALSITTTCWPMSANSISIVGKFGWAAVPTDVKRLVSLYVYDLVKPTGDPLSVITQRSTIDAVLTYAPSREITDIETRYRRVGAKSS
jgi:hypothetical protein